MIWLGRGQTHFQARLVIIIWLAHFNIYALEINANAISSRL
jgi:hypothetical protein